METSCVMLEFPVISPVGFRGSYCVVIIDHRF